MPGLLMLLSAAQEGHSAGPSSPFDVNLALIVWTWVVFVAFFLLLKKYAWPSIVKAIEERERTIQRQLESAEQANAEASARLEEQRKLLADARAEAHQLVGEAKQLAEQERAAALERTKAEQDAMLERARRDIAAERDRAVAALRKEAVDLSLAAAAKLIGERLDSDADRKIVEGYLVSLEQGR